MERADLSGTTIAGRYRVLRRLGMGGMGSVYLVQHLESLQHYALKTLHEEVADDRLAVERFLREARAAAALRSRNVVKVVDAQMHNVDGRGHALPFLVMELLEGSNLEQLVARQGQLTFEETVWVMRGVARALDVAHQKGIVHRDLKPENVFLAHDEDGEPVAKVCDFGIAKLAGDAANGLMNTNALGTQTGTTVGTPMYMAPEQARSSTDVVVQTDQWAVALIAFKALTGREYFSNARSTAELLLKIVNDPLDAPTQRLSTIPAEFDAWFFRSCRRDPLERWASAGEQVVALAEALGVGAAKAPHIPKTETAMATAETVAAASLQPRAESLNHTTAAPASRTMGGGPATTVPAAHKSKRGSLILAGGLLVVAGVGIGLVAMRRSDTPTPPLASAPIPTTPPSKSVAEVPSPPPPVTVFATTSAAPSTSASAAPTTVAKAATSAKPKFSATVTATAAPTSGKSKLPKGAACSRSSECASGFCVAEECQ